MDDNVEKRESGRFDSAVRRFFIHSIPQKMMLNIFYTLELTLIKKGSVLLSGDNPSAIIEVAF
jgi:hypothetical protein